MRCLPRPWGPFNDAPVSRLSWPCTERPNRRQSFLGGVRGVSYAVYGVPPLRACERAPPGSPSRELARPAGRVAPHRSPRCLHIHTRENNGAARIELDCDDLHSYCRATILHCYYRILIAVPQRMSPYATVRDPNPIQNTGLCTKLGFYYCGSSVPPCVIYIFLYHISHILHH